jgi:hypothetical protein
VRFCFAFLIILVITGCFSYNTHQNKVNLENYKNKYEAFDIVVFWNSSINNNRFYVEGIVKNNYVYKIRYLEITARGIDKNGNVACIANFDFFPEELQPQETKPFRIEATCKDNLSKISFFYRHYFVGDKDMRDLNFGNFE